MMTTTLLMIAIFLNLLILVLAIGLFKHQMLSAGYDGNPEASDGNLLAWCQRRLCAAHSRGECLLQELT